MKMEFEVWQNASGAIHITCEDERLFKHINIRAKEGLVSTEVLAIALAEERAEQKG